MPVPKLHEQQRDPSDPDSFRNAWSFVLSNEIERDPTSRPFLSFAVSTVITIVLLCVARLSNELWSFLPSRRSIIGSRNSAVRVLWVYALHPAPWTCLRSSRFATERTRMKGYLGCTIGPRSSVLQRGQVEMPRIIRIDCNSFCSYPRIV